MTCSTPCLLPSTEMILIWFCFSPQSVSIPSAATAVPPVAISAAVSSDYRGEVVGSRSRTKTRSAVTSVGSLE